MLHILKLLIPFSSALHLVANLWSLLDVFCPTISNTGSSCVRPCTALHGL